MEYNVRFKILSFLLTMFLVSSAYSADIDSKLSPEITEQIAKQFDSQDNGFEANIGEFKVQKIEDPTAPQHILLKEIESKIDADLEKQHYSTSGDYVILVHQPIEGQNIYRVISFKVTVEGDKSSVDNIKEIALIKLVEAMAAERVHEVPVTADPAHEDETRKHEPSSNLNPVSGLAAPSLSAEHLENVLGGTEAFVPEGVDEKKINHDEGLRLHQEPEQTQAPDMDAP